MLAWRTNDIDLRLISGATNDGKSWRLEARKHRQNLRRVQIACTATIGDFCEEHMIARWGIRSIEVYAESAEADFVCSRAWCALLLKEPLIAIVWIEIVIKVDTDDRVARGRTAPLIIERDSVGLTLRDYIRPREIELDDVRPVSVVGRQGSAVVRQTCAKVPLLIIAIANHPESRADGLISA